MTGARPFTYGQLLNEALLELNRALSGPVRFDRPTEAIAAAQARVRIYRTIARAADTCAAGLGHAADTAARLTVTERRNAARLHADLSASVAETQHVLELPSEPTSQSGVAGRLTHVADAGGLAWDLLASQLPPAGTPTARRRGPAGGLNARSVLADAALLARGMASLDVRLEPAMLMVAVEPATPSDIGRGLRQVAEDCAAVTLLGVASYAGQILQHAAAPAVVEGRQALDALTVPPTRVRGVRLTADQQVVTAAEGYLAWLVRRGHDLTVPDLLSLAATGSRLSRLVARPTAGTPNPHPAGRDTVRAWRETYQAIRRLRTIHPRPAGWPQAFQLAAWADQQLRDAHPPGGGRPPVATAIADLLPALAEAGQASLHQLHNARRLYAPAPAGGRHLYAPAGGPHVHLALHAFEAARRSSTVLAQPTPAASSPDAAVAPTARLEPGHLPWPAVDRAARTAPRPSVAASLPAPPSPPTPDIADTPLGLG